MSNTRARAPLVWILRGPKAGDYAQLQLLARAMDVPALTKQLVFRPWELLLHAFPKPTLAALDREKSDPLEAPWPDLVLTAGRRNELVARWIRAASGNRTRIVHVGRPWSNPRQFDLVVSNRQYLLEEVDNVVVNDLPLTDLTESILAPERATWGAKWAGLPHPWTVVLVGGHSGPLVFSPKWAGELAERVNARKEKYGGSVLVSTSGRTPRRSADVLLNTLKGPQFVYRWPSSEPNPFRGLLACGDEFVVTGDSMSMLAEASATGKPVYLFDFSDLGPSPSALRWKPFVHRLAMSVGPVRMRRDVGRIHAALIAAGRVRLLESTSDTTATVQSTAASNDVKRTVQRVRALLER
jgi:mitochondrial fission protein ELM1